VPPFGVVSQRVPASGRCCRVRQGIWAKFLRSSLSPGTLEPHVAAGTSRISGLALDGQPGDGMGDLWHRKRLREEECDDARNLLQAETTGVRLLQQMSWLVGQMPPFHQASDRLLRVVPEPDRLARPVRGQVYSNNLRPRSGKRSHAGCLSGKIEVSQNGPVYSSTCDHQEAALFETTRSELDQQLILVHAAGKVKTCENKAGRVSKDPNQCQRIHFSVQTL